MPATKLFMLLNLAQSPGRVATSAIIPSGVLAKSAVFAVVVPVGSDLGRLRETFVFARVIQPLGNDRIVFYALDVDLLIDLKGELFGNSHGVLDLGIEDNHVSCVLEIAFPDVDYAFDAVSDVAHHSFERVGWFGFVVQFCTFVTGCRREDVAIFDLAEKERGIIHRFSNIVANVD